MKLYYNLLTFVKDSLTLKNMVYGKNNITSLESIDSISVISSLNRMIYCDVLDLLLSGDINYELRIALHY